LEKDLSPGFKGIPEPCCSSLPNEEIEPEKLDLTIVPGIAFDKDGGRIGYGGGYYDRFLSCKNIKTVKVGFSFHQLVFEKIRTEPHDILMDYIVTESTIYTIKGDEHEKNSSV
jgi:5-formyltetrahydrofolate cyclo-ligase